MNATQGTHADGQTKELRLPLVLVVTTPGALQGRRFALALDRVSVGRAPGSDIQIDDPHVSRRHAVIRRAAGELWIEDTGSRSGTFVNNSPVSGRVRIAPGDRVRVGAVELELHALTATTPVTAGAAARFDIQAQQAGTIHNVGRDQYVYNQLAFRIAPMRRRARRLLWLGWALVFAGIAFGVVAIASYQREIFDCIESADAGCEIDFSGLAVFPVGMLVTLAGLAVIVAAFLMRRRADREERAL